MNEKDKTNYKFITLTKTKERALKWDNKSNRSKMKDKM